jgi:hypothetical protein
LLVDVTSFDARRSAGRATPTNYYDLGLLRLGVLGSYGPTMAIDAASMFIDLPIGVNQLGYSLFGTTAIKVTEQVLGGIGNPTRKLLYASPQVPGGTAGQVLWTYTVPTNRLARFDYIELGIFPGATQTNQMILLLSGAQVLVAYGYSSTVAGTYATASLPSHVVLNTGESLSVQAYTTTGGPYNTFAIALGWEFDAASWSPQ